jgi:hypothetical protein
MHPVVSRIFLLALLTLDWAGDPYHGTSSRSHPLSSTETFCHSLVHSAALTRESLSSPSGCPCLFKSLVQFVFPAPSAFLNGGPPLGGSTELAYVFMSIQR